MTYSKERKPINEIYSIGDSLKLTVAKGYGISIIGITNDKVACIFDKPKPQVGSVCQCEVTKINDTSLIVKVTNVIIDAKTNLDSKMDALRKKYSKR